MNKDLQSLQEAYLKITSYPIEDIFDQQQECEQCGCEPCECSNQDVGCEKCGCEECECGEQSIHHKAIRMAKTQLMNIIHNAEEMLQSIDDVQEFEPVTVTVYVPLMAAVEFVIVGF